MLVKNLIVGCIFLALAGNATSSDALPSGVMEGHLTILSSKPVDIGDENAATVTAGNYADYPLLVLSQDKQKEIVRITADTNGNYRAVLPPGDYLLVAQRRARKHVSVKSQRFTVSSNQSGRIDTTFCIDH